MTRPRWLRLLLDRVPADLEPAHLWLLGLLTVGLAFEQYDISLLNSAINHVARDLGMDASDVGLFTGLIRGGGLLTFGLVALADRLGRRRLFLGALAGMCLTTASTAFVQTPVQFAVVQVASRALMMTVFVTGVVIVVEEFPARHRGWGVGMLGALAGAGYGGGLLLFAAIDHLPFGWRALYALGALPLLLVPLLRRFVRETARFEETRQGRSASLAGPGWIAPILQLASRDPARAVALGAAGFLIAAGTITGLQYLAVFVQEVHGWPPWKLGATLIAGGIIGVGGNVAGGFVADRIGRRAVGFGAYVLQPIAATALFFAPEQAIAPAWAALIFFHTSGDIALRALGTELFATTHRATSLGWLVLLQTLGWTTGLLLASRGISTHADIPRVVAALSCLTLLGAFAVLALPESGSRELEELAPDE